MSSEAVPTPRFSVVMNVFNGARWLPQALASVFAQTLTDWELVFFDDRSADDSAAALGPWRGDPRVRYVLAERRVPLAQAREQAAALARAPWVAFLDQDDVWFPDKLARQWALIEGGGDSLGIVYGRALTFGGNRKVRDFDRWHELGEPPQGDIFLTLFDVSCFICQSAVCLRTAALRALPVMPAALRLCPDYYYFTELSAHWRTAATPQAVCWYRVHPDGMSRSCYVEVVQETIFITERWRHQLPPAVYRRRLRILQTLLALRELGTVGKRRLGLRRLLGEGSIAYLAVRPPVWCGRRIRRTWRQLHQPRLPAPPPDPC